MKMRGLVLVLGMMVFVGGCSWMFMSNMRTGSSSSLVDFLYPKGEVPPPVETVIPQIRVPARVGLAFVPGVGSMSLNESQRVALLSDVRDAFAGKEFIERIEIIPSTYLTGKKGFDGLNQVGRLYGVELMALVSYDQVITTGDTGASILYWTIVGAYTIKGSSNDVTTFVDTAVFDLNSQKMLFRAPGLDENSKRSTAVGVAKTAQDLSVQSFDRAVQHMTANLDVQLEQFRERIKQDNSVQIVDRKTGKVRGGAGGVDAVFILLILMGLLFEVHRKRG